MRTRKKVMLWLAGGVAVVLAPLLVLSATGTTWRVRNGYARVLPVGQWLHYGQTVNVGKLPGGTFQVQEYQYRVVFGITRPLHGAEAASVAALVKSHGW